MCCFSVVALKSRLKYYGGQTEFISPEKHWQKHSTKAFFKAKDKEIVYISQSDLGALQLIFKLKPCFQKLACLIFCAISTLKKLLCYSSTVALFINPLSSYDIIHLPLCVI